MDFDAICENQSWATVRCEPTLDASGHDVVVVVAKVAYKVSLLGRPTLTFRPVGFRAVYDGFGGLRSPAELVDVKPGTDVALVGTAHPPRGKPVEKAMAWVQAGELRKVVTIYGPRRYVADWSGVVPGPPAPLGETPLRFDHCYGGVDHRDASHASEPWNPAGRGFAVDPKTLVGREAPALEPINDLRGGPAAHASHGCFAPIPETFEPRRGRAGTHDATWARNRAPIRPKDFDIAHHSWAVPELRSSTPLAADVPFEVAGVLAEGVWRFKLPVYSMAFESTLGDETRNHTTHLDSVLIDADRRVVEQTYRTSILLPRKWGLLRRIHAYGVGDMPREVLDDEDEKRSSGGTAAPPP